MAWTIGALIGGIIGGYLFFTLFAWAFRKLSPSTDLEPTPRAAKHAFPAVIAMYALFAALNWGNAGWFTMALFYIPGIAIGWFDLRRRYMKAWANGDLDETFS